MCHHVFRKAAAWLPIVLFLGSGCLGGQTGDGEPNGDDNFGGNPNTGEGGGNCEFETEVVDDLGAVGELGFAPSEVIARATGEFETSLVWQSSPQLQLAPESGTGTLTIAVEHGAREVRIRRPVAREPSGREDDITFDGEIGRVDGCAVAYEIDVQLSFRTEGGAFDEVFESTLVASSATVASFDQPIVPAALAGSFEVLGTQPPGGVVKQLHVRGTLSPLGTYGSVDGVLEYRTEGGPGGGAISDVAVGGGGLVASWPAGSACDPDYGEGLTVELETDIEGNTLAEAVDSVNALFPRELSWQVPQEASDPVGTEPGANPSGGDPGAGPDQEQPSPNPPAPTFDELSRTTLTLRVGATGPGCARLEGDRWRLTLPVSIEAATEDAAWQGQYAGELSAIVEQDGLAGVALQAVVADLPVGTFASASGVHGLDLTGYDYGVLRLGFDLDAEHGTLEVNGADVAECVQQPPEEIVDEDGAVSGGGSAGCRGTDFVTLLRAEF